MDALVLVLIDHGLAHFTNTHKYGIVRYFKVEVHARVPILGGRVAHCHCLCHCHCHSQLQTWFDGFSILGVLFGD